MDFFRKSDTPEDEIQRAPDQDVEKSVPAHQESGPVHPTAVTPTPVDPELEKRVLRKIDWRLPTLMGFFLTLGLSNLTFSMETPFPSAEKDREANQKKSRNAKIAGMEEDLSLTDKRYSWLLTIFYISYTVFEFQALMWKIVKPHQWAAFVVFSWGLVATCQAAVKNWQGMMALRFLMGVFEAGFGPGVPYLLSFFYRRHELGLRCGLFLSAAPLANTFAGALAYGITSGHAALPNWRLLFLVEGLPVCAAAILAWFYVPDKPSTAKFLTEEEKDVARTRALQQAGDAEREGKVQWRELAETLLDAKAWFTALMYFSCNVSFSSLPVFLPTILKEMGFTSINAQGLTAPPFFASFLCTIATTWVADRIQQRGLMIAILSAIGGVGYILCATCKSVAVRYFGVFLAACGVFPSIANILPWGSDTRRGGGIILLNIIGQCGPFLGTNVFPDSQAPFYVKGMSICAAFMFFTTLLALSLRVLLVWENRQLDKKYGPKVEVDPTKGVAMTAGEDNYGASYRYVL
ncbi:hypothetical protein N7462_011655 [Penicillium macrosclerotiorum]|uniref:uncharacterized protein n=1 Tax=Penicillium macrosclerotiorum TaxID=303699 RepID=UPI002548C80B|nr:uncharacterized protein N7462_011655 [Penicillium macrosclerotiorum]KAJ5662729.1 hypothetical protein N7462_011655 [Penicillium macrosclerotiorum]